MIHGQKQFEGSWKSKVYVFIADVIWEENSW